MAEEARQNGWLSRLERAVAKGAVVDVRPGVYLPARRWRGLSPADRVLARIYAASLTHPDAVFAAHSAAALFRLPLPEDARGDVHVLRAPAGAEGLVAHADSGVGAVVERFGLRVTSPVQTVLDMAVLLDYDDALALLRAAIRPGSGPHDLYDEPPLCSKAELLEAAEAVAERTGHGELVELARALGPEHLSAAA
ncbi:hypothetical protein [Microbacterium rhizophilus]|uniref:hypothetical protein n=1 Tax=Microbacterium rhizophilus TaxID=3138934 RepID=UPI0031EE5069